MKSDKPMGDSNELLMLKRVAWERVKLEITNYLETLWIAEDDKMFEEAASQAEKFISKIQKIQRLSEETKDKPGQPQQKPDFVFWEGSRMRQLKLEIEKLIDSKMRM